MAGYHQKERLLRIDTILDSDAAEKNLEGDPLLLVKLDGIEAVSQLYAYDVIMLRDAGGREGHARPPLDTTRLIGTHAEIGARPANSSDDGDNQGQDIFYKRVGMFESFEDLLDIDLTKIFVIHERDFHLYRARVVPWVKVLSRDICYRVFEGKTVVQIIDAIADEAKKTFPHLKIDTKGLKDPRHPFAPIDYCVQFGESTLDFMSRLMARFNIRYYFGSDADSGDFVLNDVMVLKGSFDTRVPTAGICDVKVTKDDGPGIREIGKLVRRFRPPQRRVAIGGFNYLDPTHPFYQDEAVAQRDDLLKNEGGQPLQSEFSGSTSFAQPVFSQADAAALAQAAATQNQSGVLLLSGVTKNQAFVQGHSFHVEEFKNFNPNDNEDDTYDNVVNKHFAIDTLVITGNDYNYITINFLGIEKILDLFINTIKQLEADALDNTNNAFHNASLWVTQAAQAKIYPAINPLSESLPNTASGLGSDIAGVLSIAAGVVPGTVGSVLGGADFKRAVTDVANMATLAVGVIAVPADAPLDLPLPLAGRPVARGPHTAVVIGPDDAKGVDTSQHDIFCDAIGRVRVRFPWDPGPPQGSGKLPPVFPFAQPQKPTRLGGNTAWLRVVEGWAGRHYGTQFLPRIGQEVLVDFLDGDPERPVIVGRLYNANNAQSTTNLAFANEQYQNTALNKLSDLPLTADDALRFNGLKTASIPSTDPSGSPLESRFHLLRLDDTRNCEQYLIRSQARLDVTAFAHSFKTTYGNQHIKVTPGKDKNNQPFGGAAYTTVAGEYDLHVGDSKYQQVEKNYELTIKGNTQIDVKGDLTEVIRGQWSHGANEIVLEATKKITLKVGASWVVIDPCGVYITGPMVYINSGGDPGARGALKMQDITDAAAAEPGDEPNKRLADCDPNPSGHGTRNTHTDQIQPAPTCEQLTGHVDCGDYGSSAAEALMSIEGGSSIEPNQGGEPNQRGLSRP